MATGPLRILFVDDDDDGREALRALLEGLGYVVEQVDSGQRGLMRALAGQPDIVCLALVLPDTTGSAVVRLIRAAFGPRPPLFVAVTALAGERDARHALDAGFDAYLAKPHLVRAFLSAEAASPRKPVMRAGRRGDGRGGERAGGQPRVPRPLGTPR